jgi:hypothetical protein
VSNITAERGINDNNFNFFLKKNPFSSTRKEAHDQFFLYKKKSSRGN